MDEEKQLQEINITGLWHKNLYDSLERLQDFERIVRDGAVSITEYLNISPQRMPEIQFQYLKMIVTEIGILLANAKAKLQKGFFLKSKLKIRYLKEQLDFHQEEIFVPQINQQHHQTTFYLSEKFYVILDTVSQMKEEIIKELADILYGKGEVKEEGMDKTQLLR